MMDINKNNNKPDFWSAVRPNIVKLLKTIESTEQWVLEKESAPDFFKRLAQELPRVSHYPIIEDNEQEIALLLIQILARIPITHFGLCLFWLVGHRDEFDRSWGEVVFRESRRLSQDSSDQDLSACGRTILKRVQNTMRAKLVPELFINIGNITEGEEYA